jgi:hypothetical protein
VHPAWGSENVEFNCGVFTGLAAQLLLAHFSVFFWYFLDYPRSFMPEVFPSPVEYGR